MCKWKSVKRKQKRKNLLLSSNIYCCFPQVTISLSRLGQYSDAEHLILCGMSSCRFPPFESHTIELETLCVTVLYLNHKYRLAFDCLKLLIAKYPENHVVWNMFSRITAKTSDSRHHRYCIRLLLKNPDSLPLILLSGNNAFVCGSYKFAIGECQLCCYAPINL